VGGYKSYRHWIIETFSFPFAFNILGGYTGSGKTYVLDELKNKGAAVIDLEKLACHKGSAFGNIGMPKQPTQEMFENLLGNELRNCIASNTISIQGKSPSNNHNCIWLEDESQRIGQINIPHDLWISMVQSQILFINIPFEERLNHIIQEYGNLDKEKVADAIVRIQKRLGGLETKIALQNLVAGDIESCYRILLNYYDKLYRKALNKRDQSKAL
jgi:tRNA 2-selenouridine synthase